MNDEEALYTFLSVLIGTACCLGNMLVIWAVWSNTKLRQPTFCYIGSLATADFLVGSVAVPLAVLVDGRVQTSFNTCLSISCVVVTLTMASVMSLLAISVDRFLRVFIPLRYKKNVTETKTWGVVAACWFLAFILSFPPMMGWHNTLISSGNSTTIHTFSYTGESTVIHIFPHYGNSTTIICRFTHVIPMSYLVCFVFFICILTPLIVMAGLYFYIFCVIRRNLRKKAERSVRSHTYFRKERNLAQSLALILVLFAICWLPLDILNCVAYFGNGVAIPQTLFYVGILLSHANSAINPVVYGFKIPKIQEAYLKIWRRFSACGHDNQDSLSSQTTGQYLSSNTNSVARNTDELTAF